MMKLWAIVYLAVLARLTFAFPGILGRSEERDLGGILENVLGLVDGLTGSVAASVDPENKRPDAAHPFIAPGPTDQRGPCPGLNTLANHGYISRSGIVTAGEVIEATAEGFNMAADLSSLLVFNGVAFSGNIETGVFSIGGEDDRTYSASGVGSKAAGRQFGLDAHSRCEADTSATKEDFFLNHGDNHNGIGSRFARFVKLASENGNQFNVEAANQLYAQNADLSIAKNPRLYQNGYTIVVTLGEYPFIPNFFSNGTYGLGGTANYESISSFLGFQLDRETGKFCYVPEHFPENWYRRAIPYGVVDGLVPGLVPTFLHNPKVLNPLGALFNPAELPQLGCAIYQAVTSAVITSLIGSTNEKISATITYLQKNLLPVIPPVYNCVIKVGNSTWGGTTPVTQDELQETREGGGKLYGTCSA